MHNELLPESICFTRDRIGFAGFRALVRELPDEAEVGAAGASAVDLPKNVILPSSH
jgi:hypothetical protein